MPFGVARLAGRSPRFSVEIRGRANATGLHAPVASFATNLNWSE
jgi:hypothetical protein